MDLTQAETLALQLMTSHGLVAKGWSFTFDNAERRMGVCKYGPKRISISRHYTEHASEFQVLDTILHEIAHALTPGAKHGLAWKAVASRLGATPKACGENPYHATKNLAEASNDAWYTVDAARYRHSRFRFLRESGKSITLVDEHGVTLRAPRELVRKEGEQTTAVPAHTVEEAPWEKVGRTVTFDRPRGTGRTYEVTRVNPKTLTVRDNLDGKVWRVDKRLVREATR